MSQTIQETVSLTEKQVLKNVYQRYSNFVEAKVFGKKASEARSLVNARENASAHRGLFKGSQAQLVEAIEKGDLATVQASYKNIVDSKKKLEDIRTKANAEALPMTEQAKKYMTVVKVIDAQMIKNLPVLAKMAGD